MLSLLAVITYLDRVCIAVAVPRMQDELHISPEAWGWVTSVFLLSYSAFEIPTGALGDRMGRRRVLARIVAWWSAFTALTGTVSNYYVLLLMRFCFGAGEAGAYPNASAVIGPWIPSAKRTRASSRHCIMMNMVCCRCAHLCIAVVAIILLSNSVAAAQSPTAEVAGGYTILHNPDVSGNFPIGWFVSVAGKVAVGEFRPDWFGVVGEITGNYKKISPLGYDITLSSYSFMGGTKFTARNWKKLLPFAQFLVGGAIERVTSSDLDIHGSMTRFAFAPGGGVDLTLTSRVAARVGANERFVRIGSQTTNQFQLLVGGVVFWK